MEKLGETHDLDQIKNYFVEPTIIVAYCTPYLAGVLFLGIHMPIKYFLPDYIPALSVVKILVLGAFFISIGSIPTMICVALNKQVKIVFLFLAAISINAILSYLFIHFGLGISGVAVGTGFSYFALSFVNICYTLKQFNTEVKESIKFLAVVYAPFFYLLFLVLAAEEFFNVNIINFWEDLWYTGLKIFLFAIGFSLIFILIRKHIAFKKFFGSLPLKHLKILSSSG
jgi:O-antigen/teichoic acid export membrane protein